MTSKGFADLSVARDHLRLCVVRLSRLGETDVLTNLRRELATLELAVAASRAMTGETIFEPPHLRGIAGGKGR